MATPRRKRTQSERRVLYCSFCGKSQDEIKTLIAGPTVFICDECVDLCDDVVVQKMYPDRIVVRVRVPRGTHLDDSLNDVVVRSLGEKFPEIDLRYEFKNLSRSPDDADKPVLLTFSFAKVYGETRVAEKTYQEISTDLSKAISQVAVLQEQYVHESERVRALNKELAEVKGEYLNFLREHVRKSNGQSEISAVVFVDVKGFSQFEFEKRERY